MTSQAEPSPDGITYVQHLIRDIEAGGTVLCGPPVIDWPTMWERFWGTRPNAGLEHRLEKRLDEVRKHPEADRGLELDWPFGP